MKCPVCHLEKDDLARIRIEIVDKKTREIVEILYGEILCLECLLNRYKSRTSLRIYV